ncbi:MAG TPA: protein kinase [Vicinamibacterales bacterium]|nr:protein kinase [Vicinamibacterales bacterium]
MIGETVGRYHIVESIGRGGVSTVYRARDTELDRDVAIKALNTSTVDSVQIRRFEKEALALTRLTHPAIAALLELVEHDNQRLMVMELVDGETLDRLVRRQGPMAPARAAALLAQALAALAEAHRAGIIHRDIKPGNLMLTAAGPLKILDFGVALVSGTDPLTEAGFLVGTPGYMAPEQVTGQPVDARTDLYAVGLVFYFLITGKSPFSGKTPALVAQARLDTDPTPAGTHIRGLPGWVDEVLARGIARKPGERFQSADDFREALERGIRNQPIVSSGVLIAPEDETVAMKVPDFARPPNGPVSPSKPASEAPASPDSAPAPASRPPSREPFSARFMLGAAILIAALIAILLFGR